MDVATGKGAVLFPLAERVGPSGKVVGVDISKQMLAETSIAVQKRDIDWIDLVYMDAEQLDFPDNSFDAIFCGFALFFFPSMSQALSEFAEQLVSLREKVISIASSLDKESGLTEELQVFYGIAQKF